jgi:transcription-repair coupling factor (superfamily II helicase)
MSRTAPANDQSRMALSVLAPGVPGSREHLVWTGLSGDSLPLAVASAARQHNSLVVAITPDMQAAELLHDQVLFFSGRTASRPVDRFSTHPAATTAATRVSLPEQSDPEDR